MDETFRWQAPFRFSREPKQAATGSSARTGGDGRGDPVLIATLDGPINAEMAEDALKDEGIPVFIKRDTMGSVYGLSIGALARAEVWVPRPLADQARDVLIGIGLLELSEDES
jgi:hypothetical protein